VGGLLIDHSDDAHSDNARNATVEGTFSSVSGVNGNAVDFSGAGYTVVPASILNGAPAVTVATWVKLHSNPLEQHIFDFGADTERSLALTTSSSTDSRGPGYSALRVVMGSNRLEATGSSSPLETWTHWAVTVDGTTSTLYVNGQLIATAASSTRLVPKDPGLVASDFIARSTSSRAPFLDGAIDDFQIYNRALSAEEIRRVAGIAGE
jgi:hypothetical protein